MLLNVIRHGETDFNAQMRFSCSMDVPLNAVGITQAQAAAEKIAGMQFDVIISSPLRRARKTAEIISRFHEGTPVVVIDEFTERNVGVFEGLTIDEVKAKYPLLWERNCLRNPDDAPTGGETLRQFDDRVSRGIEKIRKEYRGKSVLLVCHGFVSRCINRQVNNLSFKEMNDFLLANCELISYEL